MRVGEVAERAGISDKTVRYYEGIGLLDHPPRTASGYRDYDPSVLERLGFIKAAQAVGLTLGEIREIVALRDRGETPCGHVVGLIGKRAAEVDAKIAELERMRRELGRLARRARKLDARDCEPRQVCHIIEPRPGGERYDAVMKGREPCPGM